ncbi:hypothetical protein Krac_8079 [Ktedonobacter racemifer DSM 44963]|uniref:Uncharacterized protein n=1 Tax=Ktedonobacter racemifer DSM 44963 TaxID=485913 RepID=D6TLW6_KTERA|nr:hypothetical protein Krac_8079 [Ktedonobacter racemifer DSM 44963]
MPKRYASGYLPSNKDNKNNNANTQQLPVGAYVNSASPARERQRAKVALLPEFTHRLFNHASIYLAVRLELA